MQGSPGIAMGKRERLEGPVLWFDASRSPNLLTRALQSGYSGVVLDAEGLSLHETQLSDRTTRVLDVSTLPDPHSPDVLRHQNDPRFVVAGRDRAQLRELKLRGFTTAYRAFVDDSQSLHEAIETGREHAYLMVSFKDPTNIPLELVIATLQASSTLLIKEISPEDVDDAIVTTGVMEVGADGILFSPETHERMDAFLGKWATALERAVPLQVGEITESRPVGMGYRSCIDLATLFSPGEGMIVGSTSQGGILCCPEVFHLPYMELRPFRVNAGAVHSYVYNLGNRTDYMTELRAGSPTMIVDAGGKVRRGYVGRMKTEVRPLRLLEAKFEGDARVNILLQDDWHVRIYGDDARPRNITEIRPGDRILGMIAEPGRHVGHQVAEHILET